MGLCYNETYMTVDQWKKKLQEDGFGELWVHKDPANHTYEEHSHPVDTTHVVLKGEMMVSVVGKAHVVHEGERLDIEKNTPHTATIGSKGCTFLIGARM